MAIEHFLQKLGLDEKEIKTLLAVIRLGSQPTSAIAKYVKSDRTTTYRILKQLCNKKILSQSNKKGIMVFYLENISAIQNFIDKEQERFKLLSREFNNLEPQLNALRSDVQELPRIHIYDGFEQLENFYRDIIARAREQKLLFIRFLGSNTFTQQLERKELGGLIKSFEKEMQANKIKADILIAQGNLTREWLTHISSLEIMANLPAAGGATNVILVGESTFMVSFRDFPVGIRIDHPDIAQTMHFLFDMSRKKVQRI